MNKPKPWLFFLITFGWSWLFYWPAAFTGLPQEAPLVIVLHALGGIGPALAAISLVHMLEDHPGRRDYWLRAVDPRRIKLRWYLVIFLLPPLLVVLSGLFDRLLGGPGLRLEETARLILAEPWRILPISVFYLFFGPVPEELGWRGYALEGLLRRWGLLSAGLIVGVFWAAWHLPLFWIEGSYQNQLGVGTILFWLFMLAILFQSVLVAWIYTATQHSTLAAILFHFAVNLTGQLAALSQRGEAALVGLWALSAMAVMVTWRAGKVSAGSEYPSQQQVFENK